MENNTTDKENLKLYVSEYLSREVSSTMLCVINKYLSHLLIVLLRSSQATCALASNVSRLYIKIRTQIRVLIL